MSNLCNSLGGNVVAVKSFAVTPTCFWCAVAFFFFLILMFIFGGVPGGNTEPLLPSRAPALCEWECAASPLQECYGWPPELCFDGGIWFPSRFWRRRWW